MKAIIGKKIGMSQLFPASGEVIPVSMIKVEKNTVTQIKNKDKDGYQAVQVGTGFRRFHNKPLLGHLRGKKFRYLKEFALADQDLKVGDSWGANTFQVGDMVAVSGTSKGKGFQGVVKRWGFHGHPATHGHKDQLRMPGAIGAGEPQHVFKGTRMGGHMGDELITTKTLEVVKVEDDTIYVRGAVPGARNGVLYIQGDGKISIDQPETEKSTEVAAEEKNEETEEVISEVVEEGTQSTEEVSDNKEAETVVESVDNQNK